MTREEFGIIAMALKSVYNAPNFIATNDAINIWYDLLKDLDYNTCNLAVREYMSTESKIPTPADIRKKAMSCTSAPQMNENEAWALVSRALRNGIYGAEREFNNLPPTVQKAVGSANNLHNWATSDYDTIETVIASNFMRTYRGVVARESEMQQIPTQMRDLIEMAVAQNTNYITAKDYD